MILTFYVRVKDHRIQENDTLRITTDPFVIGVLVGFFTFLITFRANFAYGRYWEATTDCHLMLSKWLDSGLALAAFHLQSHQYDAIKPPILGTQDSALGDESRSRARLSEAMTSDQHEMRLNEAIASSEKNVGGMMNFMQKHRRKSVATLARRTSGIKFGSRKASRERLQDLVAEDKRPPQRRTSINAPTSRERFQDLLSDEKSPRVRNKSINADASSEFFSGGFGILRDKKISRHVRTSSKLNGGIDTQEVSLFLQEAAHLLSLLSAVAMATLRHDQKATNLPLTKFKPGEAWPPVDPDDFRPSEASDLPHIFWRATYFVFGLSRSVESRSAYNAARPFQVFGGISDEEVRCLQEARGPYAKVSLCSMWLTEFIARETKAGSTGEVSGPLLSRLFHMVSDGMVGYNQCRKVAYVDFPFPSAQITILFILVIIFVFPLLFFSYVNSLAFACVLNFTTVVCFVGLNEVARELESPFENVPNDIPLTRFQAQFNEALCVMFAGYHPDSWWELPEAIPPSLLVDTVLSDLSEGVDSSRAQAGREEDKAVES